MRYIVSIDGSSVSQQAVNEAVVYAQEMGAELEIVHSVQRRAEASNGERVLEAHDSAEERGRKVLSRGKRWVGDCVEVETTLLWGDPGEEVSAYANDTGADVVFVGHRGLAEKHEELVGSVAKSLIGNTEMPVMVVGGRE